MHKRNRKMKKLESSLLNMVVVLTVVTAVAAGLLAWGYHVTEGPISLQAQKTLADGIKAVMGCDDITVAAPDSITKDYDGKKSTYVVYTVKDNGGNELGKAVESTVMAFGGEMKVLVGFNRDNVILGYRVLESAETPGLGQKADTWFQKSGKGCIVGKGAMLKDAVIGDGAIIPDGMSIEGTIDRTAYKRKAVFIDRDDTINDDVGHCSRPEDIRLLPGVSNAIASLNRSGFLVIMVTNQSVIGRGMVDEKGLDAIHDKLREDLLATGGGVIDDIFYCPHLPDAGCDCRKPKPMLGLKAIEKYGIDPRYSFMVGDSDKDIEFGRNIGVKPIKVDGDYTFVDAVNDIIDA